MPTLDGCDDNRQQLPIPAASASDRTAISALAQKCLDAKGVGCEEWEKEISRPRRGVVWAADNRGKR
jgi:hypothetical protein